MESSYPPRHRINYGAVSVAISVVVLYTSVITSWVILSESSSNQQKAIDELRLEVAVLKNERIVAAVLVERMDGFQRTLVKIEGAVERIERQDDGKRRR